MYDAQTVGWARAAGFAYACTSTKRPVSASDDAFELPRLHVDNEPVEAFQMRLASVLAAG